MGKRGPASTVAGYTRAGYVRQVPISHAEAEAILGETIPEAAWAEAREAREAVRGVGFAADAADKGPRLNRNPKDPLSYAARRDRAEKRLMDALRLTSEMLADRAFVEAMEEAAVEASRKGMTFASWDEEQQWLAFFDLRAHLKAASTALLNAETIVARAREPRAMPAPSLAQAKTVAVRRIREAFADAGLPTDVSPGSYWQALGPEARRDWDSLQRPFERLVRALCIVDETSPEAFARALRRALDCRASE